MDKGIRRACVLTLAFGLIFVSIHSMYGASLPPLRQVNAPYFPGPDNVRYEQSAVFWFGRVNSTDNYADVRLSYDDTKLYVNVSIFDRWLWYDETPTLASLINWDSVSLYLDTNPIPGGTLDANAYRFDGQLTWWEHPRTAWQATYRGNGSSWTAVTVPITTEAGWWGVVPNDNAEDDRGWALNYYIPFASLGLSGPPSPGTLWGLGVVVHDRDNATGSPPIADSLWPEGMTPNQSETWGQLHFGIPSYTPQPAVPRGTTTIRHKLNGATVVDAAVGGGTNCGGGLDYWTQWGTQNYAGVAYFNVQNEGIVSEWPCVSKYFVTFPLSALPSGKIIISATLTLHQFGNAGQGETPGPEPSYIQVFTVDHDWNESTLTWNNAPSARENIAATWVNPLDQYPGEPGIPHTWDVSRAVAEVYAAGEPLRLALYSADWPFHSGRYFWSSEHDDYHPEARPSLTVVWGEPASTIHATVWPNVSSAGNQVTYTLAILGSGHALTMTDDLPSTVSSPGAIVVIGGNPASYHAGMHRVAWTDTPLPGQFVTMTFPVTVLTHSPVVISNRAILTDALMGAASDTAIVIANPLQVWLPLIMK